MNFATNILILKINNFNDFSRDFRNSILFRNMDNSSYSISHANWNFLLNIWYGYYAWDLQALNIFGFSYIWFWIRISSTQNVNANDLHFEIKKIYQVFSCNHISNDIAIASSPLVSLEFYEKQLDDEYFMRFYSILGLISFEMNNFDFFASMNSK